MGWFGPAWAVLLYFLFLPGFKARMIFFSETEQPKQTNSAHLVWLGQTKEQQAERPQQHCFYELAKFISCCPLLKSETL